ncbi:hypothetical protein ACT80S_01510 [Ramlibacter sp. MAHUQ-53]|uniref:hypothetical protein n=1 Tax=unclassified Ramlibacter TaxID=2617605 RepID=UPI00362AA5D7
MIRNDRPALAAPQPWQVPDDPPEPPSGVPVPLGRSLATVARAGVRGCLHTFGVLMVGLLAKAGTYACSATGPRTAGVVANGLVIGASGLGMVRGVEVAVEGVRAAAQAPGRPQAVGRTCKAIGTSLALAASLVPATVALCGDRDAQRLGAQLLAINAGRVVQGLVSDVAADLSAGMALPTRLAGPDGRTVAPGTLAYQHALLAGPQAPARGLATLGGMTVPALVPYALAVWGVSAHVMPRVAESLGVAEPPAFGEGPWLDHYLSSLSVGVGIALIEGLQTLAATAIDAAVLGARGLATDEALAPPQPGAAARPESGRCLDAVRRLTENLRDRASLRLFFNALFLDTSVALTLMAPQHLAPALSAVAWALIDPQRALGTLARHRSALAELPPQSGDFLTEAVADEEAAPVRVHPAPRLLGEGAPDRRVMRDA